MRPLVLTEAYWPITMRLIICWGNPLDENSSWEYQAEGIYHYLKNINLKLSLSIDAVKWGGNNRMNNWSENQVCTFTGIPHWHLLQVHSTTRPFCRIITWLRFVENIKKMLVLVYYVGSGVFSLRSIQFYDQMASESSKIESRLNDWPVIVAVNIRT